jgi:ABC-2 type transport system permease protein
MNKLELNASPKRSFRAVTLIRRELIENRRSMIYAPLVLCALLLLMLIISMIWNGAFNVNSKNFQLQALLNTLQQKGPEALPAVHAAFLVGWFTIVHVVLGVVMFNYALGCLFEERKDRSTLFWRSLPVRDWETVLAKAFTLLVVIPAIYMICLVSLQIISTLAIALACQIRGLDANQLVFNAIPFSRTVGWELATQAITSLWVLPIFAWMMLCSAYAKQRPFLLAVLLPGILTLILGAMDMSRIFALANGEGPSAWMAQHFFGRAAAALTPNMGINFKADEMRNAVDFTMLGERLLSVPMLIGVVIGLALLAATAYVRRYREDATL